MFTNAESVFINGKEVKSIITSDGGVIYQKQLSDPIIINFTGTTLTQGSYAQSPLIGTNVVIDYGDGTVVQSDGNFGHTYTEQGTYEIKIYNVTSLGNWCFAYCSGLTSIIIPEGVTSLEPYCFNGCSGLTSVYLNWDTSNEIITYNSLWIQNTNENLKFIIPDGTTQLYVAKGYPIDQLIEYGDLPSNLTLTCSQSSLSYVDGDKAVLTATVLNQDDAPIRGHSVLFKIGSTVLDTVQTNSEGQASYEYTSQGVGDVTITAECMDLQETYELEDWWKYDPSVYSSSQALRWALPSGDFEITAHIEIEGNGIAYLFIGTSYSSSIRFGHITNSSQCQLSTNNNNPVSRVSGNNIDHTLQVTGTTVIYSANGIRSAASTPSNLSHTLNQVAASGGRISNIRIKSL